jgi:hypothetical protein
MVAAGPYTSLWENNELIYTRPVMWFDELDIYYTGIETVNGDRARTIGGRQQFDRAEDAARSLAELILNFVP